MTTTDHGPCVIVALRHGEIFLKGRNRQRFEDLLHANVQRALADLEPSPELSRGQGRLFVRCDPALVDTVCQRLSRVFGIVSLSPGAEVPQEMEVICQRAVALVQQQLLGGERPSFRVTAKRADKRFPTTSQDIGRVVGGAIVEATGLGVDLHQPDLVVGVEVGPRRSLVFARRIPGVGGLPVGASGDVALLLSGGIDSPVAGHLMQKRGCVLHPIYFHAFPYTGERTRDKVLQLAARLAAAQRSLTVRVVPFTEIQLAIRDHCPADLTVVLYRRMMMRIASQLAQDAGCSALATGENLGQVASQTLQNLACIEASAALPVLRPLLCFDKTETIALARAIDTYELSILPYDDCCSLFVPKHPETRASASRVESAERKLDLEALVQQAVEATEQHPVTPPTAH